MAYNTLTDIGNCPNDPYFSFAKEAFLQISRDLNGNNMNCQSPQNVSTMHCQNVQNGSTDFLLTQLNAWEQATHCLQKQMTAVQIDQQHLLNTVFKFEPDHFKMLVDVRGYKPQEIKLTFTITGIELTVTHEQTVKGSTGSGYANRTISRLYEMPLTVSAEQVSCNITPDGTLCITAPWIRNCP